MAREKSRNVAHPDFNRHSNSRDETQYLTRGETSYPVGEYGRDFIGGQDRGLGSPRGYPVGEYGRYYDARDLRRNQGARDLSQYGGSRSYEGIGARDVGQSQNTPGVQSHRGRGPKDFRRSDTRIHDEVCERLTDDHFVDASEITIEVKESEVTLSGTVASR